jgi:hypothetical protein
LEAIALFLSGDFDGWPGGESLEKEVVVGHIGSLLDADGFLVGEDVAFVVDEVGEFVHDLGEGFGELVDLDIF